MATKRITNSILLDHIRGVSKRIDGIDQRIDTLEKTVNRRFDDTQLQMTAIQEDLNASIAMLGRHQRKLARL